VSGTDRRPLEITRDLAARHPDVSLPCPVCAGPVRARNLERHLDKVHAGRSGPAEFSWRGPERLVLRPLVLLPLLCAAAVITWSWRSGRELRPWFLIVAGVGAVFVVLCGLAVADVRLFLGRLSVDGSRVRLRHTLGLLTRTLPAVDRVIVGSAYRTVPDSTVSMSADPDVGGGSTEVPAGAYLRMFDGRRSIVVHCRNNTGMRKTWTGWQQGKRRRTWAITLDPPEFVGLQYALAAAGLLQVPATS
jgi:hypothetical protein